MSRMPEALEDDCEEGLIMKTTHYSVRTRTDLKQYEHEDWIQYGMDSYPKKGEMVRTKDGSLLTVYAVTHWAEEKYGDPVHVIEIFLGR